MGTSCINSKKKIKEIQRNETEHVDRIKKEKIKEDLNPLLSQKSIWTIKVKCSTYFTEKGLSYYQQQLKLSQNNNVHFILRLGSYFEDEASYDNVSQLLLTAKRSSRLTLDFQNSLLRKKRIFSIVRDRLPQFHQLQKLTFNIGFCYVPNETAKIFSSILPKCNSLSDISLDFQLDVFIKARTLLPQDKPFSPNDKIAGEIAQDIKKCKNLKSIQLNFSQIDSQDQNFNSFFEEMSYFHQILSVELILRNCSFNDLHLEKLGDILLKNKQIIAFKVMIDNNPFENIMSFFKSLESINSINIKSRRSSEIKLQANLIKFQFQCTSLRITQNELEQFIEQLSYFTRLTSFALDLSANNYSFDSLTSFILLQIPHLFQFSLGSNILSDFSQRDRVKIKSFWQKIPKMIELKID